LIWPDKALGALHEDVSGPLTFTFKPPDSFIKSLWDNAVEDGKLLSDE